uniref:Peptide/nickel transport system permease protein n=1 Tax=Candidatus Kentrum sp. TC TaxID=2126339 RepID=A0A450Z990_9GAMM|nr:MAG: hypothetical protein BECKTC1821E_GA0114239_10435 [Candidatus Kentron sp. TC]VFK50322.1 MAG: hypothetical protein BECKTC1821D_GA0114238_10995 [Candidatus Kentron sp. TC]VFK62671.1 MAG: hypothetical protein BECKTC1821F_GA0114240_10788 [Candidatus Kentron sp. TC]
MLRFLFFRLSIAPVVVLGMICLLFFLIHPVLGDSVEVMLGKSLQPAFDPQANLGLSRSCQDQENHT